MTDAERRGPVKPAKVHIRRSREPRTVCGHFYLDLPGRDNPPLASSLSEATCGSCIAGVEKSPDEGGYVSSKDYARLTA